jgi:hypothetical protein
MWKTAAKIALQHNVVDSTFAVFTNCPNLANDLDIIAAARNVVLINRCESFTITLLVFVPKAATKGMITQSGRMVLRGAIESALYRCR